MESWWYGPHGQWAGEWDGWYQLEWADAVQTGILHPFDWVLSLVVGNWCVGAPENHWTGCNTFPISVDSSCERNIRVNSVNGFKRRFHHLYFLMATYWKCERGLWIYRRIQFHLPEAQAQYPVYQSWLYEGDTVLSCPSRLVRYWLCKSCQPSIQYWYMVKYLQSPSFVPAALSGRAIVQPCIATGASFNRNPCPQSVQKYPINLTQRSIRSLQNSQLWIAILGTNWGGLRTWGLWNGAWIWSECSQRQYIYELSDWAVILPSTKSLPYICWSSGTWLQGRIQRCQPRDYAWILQHLGPMYGKWLW